MTGFPQLNKINNPSSKTIERNLGLNQENLNNSIITGRVLDIILDDKHPKFKELGEWSSIGTIEFTDVRINEGVVQNSSNYYAKPLLANYKSYPILNEIVYIIELPDQGSMNDNAKKQFYYFNIINVWNHPHHNAVPFFLTPENDNKKYDVVFLGSTNQSKLNNNKINLGPGFQERSDIHPLHYYLGDNLLEGRWGQSIRLGSTVKNSSNIWSKEGENGDPILIIRNGQPINNPKEGWMRIVEDINNDLASMYFTSTQVLPIKTFSSKYDSFNKKPIFPEKYNSKQIVLTSGRLLFVSNKDHILFNSIKSIGFSSLESVNIDTNEFIADSPIIKLGNKSTKNPMLRGDETFDTLDKIIDSLIRISEQLITLAEILPSIPSTNINIAAAEVVAELTILKGKIAKPGYIKSINNFLI